jgi:hypothetical protein
MGIVTSDSGSESILKFVFERNGLSGINLFEHEDPSNARIDREIKVGFQELNIL